MSLQLVVTFQVHRHLHVRVWNNVIRKLKLVHKEQESIVQDGMKPRYRAFPCLPVLFSAVR
jgi:hypothetical protein